MGNVLINEKYLSDIAAALRAKHDTSRTYKTNEMAEAIRAIPLQPAEGISPDDMFMGTWDGAVVAERATVLNNAFEGMPITYVKAPNVEEIDGYAFQNCDSLTTFVGGPKTIEVGYSAFENCSKLKDVGSSYYSTKAGSFQNCSSLKQIRLYPNLNTGLQYPDNDDYVGTDAFTGCSSLRKIDVVSPLPGFDFAYNTGNCDNFVALILRSEDTFCNFGNPSTHKRRNGYVYVPASMYDEYVANASKYTYSPDVLVEILRKIEDYPDICDWREV